MNAPAMVNHLPVVASRRKRTGPGELAEQFYVICRDSKRDHGPVPAQDGRFIVWTVGYDPSYQGGQWVACNGRYDLPLARAEVVMDERARGDR